MNLCEVFAETVTYLCLNHSLINIINCMINMDKFCKFLSKILVNV